MEQGSGSEDNPNESFLNLLHHESPPSSPSDPSPKKRSFSGPMDNISPEKKQRSNDTLGGEMKARPQGQGKPAKKSLFDYFSPVKKT